MKKWAPIATDADAIRQKQRRETNKNVKNTEKDRRFSVTCDKKRKSNPSVISIGRVVLESPDFMEDEVELHYLGKMNYSCQFCHAKHFVSELPGDKKYNSCCHTGKVRILEDNSYLKEIHALINGNDAYSKNFVKNLRSYNNYLAFASFSAKLDAFRSRGPFVFRICGQTYHDTYALYPDVNESRKYGQLYIVDNEIATRVRMQHPGNSGCLPEVLSLLDDVIRRVNPYAKAFNMMYEVEGNEKLLSNLTGCPVREVRMWLKRDDTFDKNLFNIPTCNEVAVVFVAEDGDPPLQRDICVYSKSKCPISMSSLSQHVDPMTYPLIFPSALQYYSFMLSDRGGFNPCLSMGSLSQQYIFDMWTKVESHCLYFIRDH
ncbi:uncharacterized protein LOC124413857 [Diprion similis]|uniref:uncharacterized protein LOC124413857 n=1 Tax=Diprion similis TaxID=362088 RepID=UPI001EF82CAF|nr:uncharacterized protein LOC124413857 [Diprion similis]